MPDEVKCVGALRSLRWPDGMVCVRCGSRGVVKRGFDKAGYQRYCCKACSAWFGDKAGTVFERSGIRLRVWFMLAFLMQYSVSILEASKTLGMGYKTVFYTARKLGDSIYAHQIREKLKGIIEMDELYVTAGLKGKKG